MEKRDKVHDPNDNPAMLPTSNTDPFEVSTYTAITTDTTVPTSQITRVYPSGQVNAQSLDFYRLTPEDNQILARILERLVRESHTGKGGTKLSSAHKVVSSSFTND